MLGVLQTAALLLSAITMSLPLAHALEIPGKLRLEKDDYITVQRIYYPGFTIGGAAEPAAILCTLVLCIITPRPTPAFWLTIGAFLALAAMQVVYWGFIHAINSVWLKDAPLGSVGSGFFGLGGKPGAGRTPEWTELRNRWEYGHVARAVLAFLSLALLLAAAGRVP
jgi:hypothetical protein